MILLEVLGALKFAGYLVAFGVFCGIVTKCPLYQALSECLFPGRYEW